MTITEPDVRRPPDLRLVPPALAVWAMVLAGVGLGPVVGGILTVLAVLAGPWVRARPVLLAMAGCAAAAGLVVTAQTAAVELHPLRAAAVSGSAATLRVVPSDDPRPIRAAVGGTAQVLVPATLVEAEADGGRWSSGGRVLLIAPADGWADLLPGQAVTAEGLLAPAGRRDLTVAVLRVRTAPAEVAPPPWWQTAAGGLRSGLRDAAGVLPESSAGLLPGLAVGDTSRQTSEVEDDFRASGLTHLTAVSGDTARQTGV